MYLSQLSGPFSHSLLRVGLSYLWNNLVFQYFGGLMGHEICDQCIVAGGHCLLIGS